MTRTYFNKKYNNATYDREFYFTIKDGVIIDISIPDIA
jgi:hypothetical protein